MAHYAFLDENDVVTEVIVGKNEGNFDWEQQYASFRGQACKRTSYNTRGNQHPEGRPLRGNYAGIGFTYDRENDVFYAPQPCPSWVLNQSTWLWESPVAYPNDGQPYEWDESTVSWKAKEQL
jgi:hypothetical protein